MDNGQQGTTIRKALFVLAGSVLVLCFVIHKLFHHHTAKPCFTLLQYLTKHALDVIVIGADSRHEALDARGIAEGRRSSDTPARARAHTILLVGIDTLWQRYGNRSL